MPIYAVIRKSDQVQVHRYASDAPVEWQGMEFDTHDHIQEAEPVETEVPVPVRHITKLAFRNRFTQSEKVAIEIAALDNPAAPMQARAQSAALRASQQDVQVAQYIDLNRPDTRTGVQQLEAVGLLAAGRALVILDTDPTDAEVWRG